MERQEEGPVYMALEQVGEQCQEASQQVFSRLATYPTEELFVLAESSEGHSKLETR